jgi:hypothetical protein
MPTDPRPIPGKWRPCAYHEWRGTLPDGEGCVLAALWPPDGAPALVHWVELADGDDPREADHAHHAVRMLAFWDWEDLAP